MENVNRKSFSVCLPPLRNLSLPCNFSIEIIMKMIALLSLFVVGAMGYGMPVFEAPAYGHAEIRTFEPAAPAYTSRVLIEEAPMIRAAYEPAVFAAPAPAYGHAEIRSFEPAVPAYTSHVSFEEAPMVRAAYEPAVFAAPAAYATPALEVRTPHIPIMRFSEQIQGGISDIVAFETGNGIRVNDETHIEPGYGTRVMDSYGNVMEDNDGLLKKSGSFSYISPEGIPIETRWVADENGFHVEGAHLPVAPEMPAELVEAYRAAEAALAAAGPEMSAPAPAMFRSEFHGAPVMRDFAPTPMFVRSAY